VFNIQTVHVSIMSEGKDEGGADVVKNIAEMDETVAKMMAEVGSCI